MITLSISRGSNLYAKGAFLKFESPQLRFREVLRAQDRGATQVSAKLPWYSYLEISRNLTQMYQDIYSMLSQTLHKAYMYIHKFRSIS